MKNLIGLATLSDSPMGEGAAFCEEVKKSIQRHYIDAQFIDPIQLAKKGEV